MPGEIFPTNDLSIFIFILCNKFFIIIGNVYKIYRKLAQNDVSDLKLEVEGAIIPIMYIK